MLNVVDDDDGDEDGNDDDGYVLARVVRVVPTVSVTFTSRFVICSLRPTCNILAILFA